MPNNGAWGSFLHIPLMYISHLRLFLCIFSLINLEYIPLKLFDNFVNGFLSTYDRSSLFFIGEISWKCEWKNWCDFLRFSIARSEGEKNLPNFYRKECVAKDVEGWANFVVSIWFIAIFEDDCHFFYIFLLTITTLATNKSS
jgi:hypothetical protein